MFSRKPFEWVPCFPARSFISPTSITPTFESFSLQLFLRKTLNGQSSRSLSLIISEASVLRFSVTDSGGGITVVTRGVPKGKLTFVLKASGDLRIRIRKMQWLILDYWGCLLHSDPKLAVGSQIGDIIKKQTFAMLSGSWPWRMLWGTGVNLQKKKKIRDKNLFSDSVKWSAKML